MFEVLLIKCLLNLYNQSQYQVFFKKFIGLRDFHRLLIKKNNESKEKEYNFFDY